MSDTPVHSFGAGRADSASLRLAFPLSPLFTDYRDQQIRETFDRPPEVLGADGQRQLNDGGYAYGIADRDYQQSPDLATVPVGGGGLPGSPFGPNIAAFSHNPADIPASGVEATERVRSRSNGAFIGNSLISPIQTARGIAPRRLGTNLANGVGSGNSFIVRI